MVSSISSQCSIDGEDILLIRLIITFRIANLAAHIILLVEHVIPDTLGIRPLQIGIEVDLHHTVGDRILVVFELGAGTAVEDQEDGLLVLGALLLLHVLLVLTQQLRAQLHIARLVHTVHVAKARGDREVGANGRQGLVDLVDVFGLGVEAVVVDALVVDAVFLAAGDADLHLQPLLHGRGALEVGGGGLDVPVHGLLRQVDHVRGEERLAVLLVPLLVGVEHAVQPWEQLLGAVVGVQHDGDAVRWSDGADVVGGCDGSGDGGFLVLVVDAFAGEVGGAALGELQDDG